MTRNAKLRQICRGYLQRLKYMAEKHGLGGWIDSTIELTKDENCKPTEHEAILLSRAVNDERIMRLEIPPLLGKGYQDCFNDDDFGRIKKFNSVGRYSKVSALLYAEKQNERKAKDTKIKQ